MTMLDDVGAIAGILGAILSAVAIWITVRIYRRTGEIQKKQRENEEGLYVTKTKENLKQIQSHFDNIFTTVENHDRTDEEDKQLITQELNLYFRKNHGEMIKLLQRSERSLELWVSLDHAIRDKFDKIISDFGWVTSAFFPLTVEDDELRTRIWIAEYDRFLEKKYHIDNILEKELKAES